MNRDSTVIGRAAAASMRKTNHDAAAALPYGLGWRFRFFREELLLSPHSFRSASQSPSLSRSALAPISQLPISFPAPVTVSVYLAEQSRSCCQLPIPIAVSLSVSVSIAKHSRSCSHLSVPVAVTVFFPSRSLQNLFCPILIRLYTPPEKDVKWIKNYVDIPSR